MLKYKRRSRFIPLLCLFAFFSGFAFNESRSSSRSKEEFPLQLDHVLIWVTKGAPEAKVLENAGLKIQDRTHQHYRARHSLEGLHL